MAQLRAAGTEPGQRQLNGPQTTGRQYRNLSPAVYGTTREDNAPVLMRDGTRLLADIHRPEADGRFPALVAASPYPRQLQDLGAPASFLEAGMPGHLTWTSEPLPTDTDMVGQPELRLTATSTASGTAWILLLQDVDPDGNATDITEGWLRVGMRHTDEGTSDTGRAALPVQAGESIPPGQPVDYRIPLVTNARRFQRGHRIRLILTSDDTLEDFQPMALFSHAPLGIAGINTVHSRSRLLLPILDSE